MCNPQAEFSGTAFPLKGPCTDDPDIVHQYRLEAHPVPVPGGGAGEGEGEAQLAVRFRCTFGSSTLPRVWEAALVAGS